MMGLWIGLGAAVVLVLIWRLRKAASTLDRILTEERERTITDAATERADHPADRPNR
jgi:hypothetical protein